MSLLGSAAMIPNIRLPAQAREYKQSPRIVCEHSAICGGFQSDTAKISSNVLKIFWSCPEGQKDSQEDVKNNVDDMRERENRQP